MNRRARIQREIARRYRLREKCEGDPQAQALTLAHCQNAPLRWINDWAWTYDPRNAAKGLPVHLPLKLYPRQEELVDWTRARRQAGENGAIEKARGVGATYVEAALSVWLWLFEDAVSVKWGSRTEADVDQKGNPDSIFQKIRTILYRLPRWQWPRGYDRDEHDNQKRLINPETGAHLIGQQGSNMGRGGRSSIYFWDESAFHDHPRQVERAVKENTDCLIEISTHAGPGTPFARKVDARTVQVLEMAWHCVPWRGQAWYDQKKEEYAHDPIGFARNIDKDPGGSTERVVIPKKYVDAAAEIDLVGPAGVPVAGLDIGESHDLNAFVTRSGPRVETVDSWGDTDTTQTARRAVTKGEAAHIRHLYYDNIGIGAGVSGELQNFERETDDGTLYGEEAIEFAFTGVNVGDEPTRTYWPNDKRSDEWLANLKAELWWRVRERFRKTYERVAGEADHPDAECISIPDHGQLKAQLSWPKYEIAAGGRYKLERKKKTKERLDTHQSYDFADALVLAFASDVLPEESGIIV
ncbi:MAG: hypothetical protein ABEN55_21660 [Bradymonadaceae bacterium]